MSWTSWSLQLTARCFQRCPTEAVSTRTIGLKSLTSMPGNKDATYVGSNQRFKPSASFVSTGAFTTSSDSELSRSGRR